jgi:hypothetical protein
MKFSSKCQRELPKPAPQVRQDYGLGTHAGEGDLSREINTPKNIVRQSYGLGPARICFKPQKNGFKQKVPFVSAVCTKLNKGLAAQQFHASRAFAMLPSLKLHGAARGTSNVAPGHALSVK